MSVPYLIAANAILLTLSVAAANMLGGSGLTELGGVSIAIGIGTAQACLLGTFLACSSKPFAIRIRWFSRLVLLQWFCLVMPLVPHLSRNDFHWQFPWCVLIDQLSVAMASFLSVGVYRLVSRRVVTKIENATTPTKSSNVRILDMLILISLVAVFLSIAMRFKKDPVGLEGILYAVMVVGGLFVGSPIGALLPFFFLGYLAEGKKPMVRSAIASSIAMFFGLGPFLYYNDSESRIGTLLFSSTGLSVVLANTFAFRSLWYRLVHLPRTQAGTGNHDTTPIITAPIITTPIITEESSHA